MVVLSRSLRALLSRRMPLRVSLPRTLAEFPARIVERPLASTSRLRLALDVTSPVPITVTAQLPPPAGQATVWGSTKRPRRSGVTRARAGPAMEARPAGEPDGWPPDG